MAPANFVARQGEKLLCWCLGRPLADKAPAAARWSSSNARWKQRQGKDVFAREAKVNGLKSRAAFKLLEMDSKFRLFKPGQTVVDLGYAPGSWSQVAQERTRPHGRVIGIDLIPAQPPRGVATFQGDFLSPMVQRLFKEFIVNTGRKRDLLRADTASEGTVAEEPVLERPSYIDRERLVSEEVESTASGRSSGGKSDDVMAAAVDVVLSDMSEPWQQTSGFMSKTLTNPYRRLMNTSGVGFRDHAGSMDLCAAALQFASESLRPGGHFVCKFYQGSEDKKLEEKLKSMFAKVVREKPQSSRSESKEAYFVALRRKHGVVFKPDDTP